MAFQVLRLPDHLPVPVDPKPLEIFENQCFGLKAAAFAVEILHAQQNPPVLRTTDRPAQKQASGIAQMQGS